MHFKTGDVAIWTSRLNNSYVVRIVDDSHDLLYRAITLSKLRVNERSHTTPVGQELKDYKEHFNTPTELQSLLFS